MARTAIARSSGRLRVWIGLALACAITAVSVPGTAVAGGALPALPKLINCGDIAAGTWLVRDNLSGKGLTGRYYSVHAINFPCARARSLVRRLTRMRSLGRGPSALIPGFI